MIPLYETVSRKSVCCRHSFLLYCDVYIYSICFLIFTCVWKCLCTNCMLWCLWNPCNDSPLYRWYLLGLKHSVAPLDTPRHRDHGCSNKGGESAPIKRKKIKHLWMMSLFYISGTSTIFLIVYFTSTFLFTCVFQHRYIWTKVIPC